MPKILAIDDKTDNLITLSALLKALIPGCEVITAQAGPEGIAKAKAELPDTILLDIKMPGMDGYEVCKSLKDNESTKHIPVIMLTAIKTESGDLVKGLETGADAYLAKPIDEYALAAQVKTALRIKKAEDQLHNQKDFLEEMVRERTGALRESEEKYRNLVEESFDGIFIQRGQSIIFANKRLNEMLGYREGELIGQNHWVVYHPDYQKLTRARAQARMRGEEVLRRYEVKLQRKDGSWFYGEVNARPITFPSDEESGIQVWVKDIDERKQTEEALQESEEHLRSFMESAKGFIVYRLEVDPENYFSGRLVFVSPGIEDEIGISPEAEFSEWFNNIHPDDLPGLIEAQAKSVRNRDTFDQEFRWKNMKGEWGWCHAISNPVFDSDGNPAYYNGLIVNLTAQKQAEKFRFISSTLLTAQEREKKRISLDLHDELGQSLVVLKLQLRSIQRRLEEGQTELRSDCQAMLDYIVGLIENIRRICMDLTPGILDDLGLTAGIRWLVENTLKSHDIDTSLDITNIDKLLTNEQQLLVFRIFQEAFTNIVRHSCASLTSIVIKKRGGEISFVIEDNGKGFDVKETMSIDFTERGMGLSAIEERAWMLGGSVNIRSERELGTRIAFQVPHRVNPNVA